MSPLLANLFLHYALDAWLRRHMRSVRFCRYADDGVIHCKSEAQAKLVLRKLSDRLCRCRLELHPEKTRLIEFGPWARKNRACRGEGKPETFDFLGFTHICSRKRSNGMFTVLRQTMRKRLTAKLGSIKTELRRRLHHSIPEVGRWLRSVVEGHMRYFAVPMNGAAVARFRFEVARLWHRAMCRRSQKGRVLWERMYRLIDRYLPKVRVCHPYPLQRLGVITQGRSRMR